ncbi:MAG: hypothetical protein ACRDBG_21545, partial [Waterburya sp.]
LSGGTLSNTSGGGQSFGSSQTNLVEEIVVTTPVSSISFNPDNLIFGEDYLIIFTGLSSPIGRVDIRINGDSSNTGYQVQFLSVNSTTLTSGRELDSNGVFSPSSLTVPSTGTAQVSTIGGNFRWMSNEIRDIGGNVFNTMWWGKKNTPVSTLSSMTLFARSSNFQAGTTLRLYRLNNSTNLVNRPVQTNNFTTLRQSNYPIDTSTAPITATLDLSANWRVGDRVTFFDDVGTFSTSTNTGFSLNPLTIQSNSGQNISGSASIQLTNDCQSITLVYRGSGRFVVA